MKKYMHMIAAVILVISIYTPFALSDEIEYNAVCVEEQNIGYAWKNNDWTFARFHPQKYMITKVKVRANDNFIRCKIKDKPSIFGVGGTKIDAGCYNIRKFGDEYYSIGNVWCYEEYKQLSHDSKKYKLVSVACSPTIYEVFVFNPSGYFHRSYIHNFLSRKNKENDTMHLSVGSCSKIPK